ncbi:helicase HerA domain-containing protein [Glycomyces paridis]|nr:DUF87 domain-containing protein [Glycomyces paridis]
MTTALEALRLAPSDFAVTPDDIWHDSSRPHVKGINEAALRAVEARINAAARSPRSSVTGLPIVGSGGSGKSHLAGVARQKIQDRGGFFVRLNIINVRDFWESLADSYLTAFTMPHRMSETGLSHLLESLARAADVPTEVRKRLLGERQPDPDSVANFLEAVRALDPSVAPARNTLRALLLLHAADEIMAQAADLLLHGDEAEVPGFPKVSPRPPAAIVRDLSQLMALCGPTLIAVDQVDEIVRASSRGTAVGTAGAGELLDILGNGLTDLRDATRRTTVLLSCIDGTWEEFRQNVADTVLARFEKAVTLDRSLPDAEVGGRLLAAVLAPIYDEAGFDPPYPSYPFGELALSTATLFGPRQLLTCASAHLNRCLDNGEVVESGPLEAEREAPAPRPRPAVFDENLDDVFAALRAQTDVAAFADPDTAKPHFTPLLKAALQAMVAEDGRFASWKVEAQVGTGQHFHAELVDADAEPKSSWSFLAIANTHPNAVRSRVDGLYRRAKLGQPKSVWDGHGVLWVTAPYAGWEGWGSGSQTATVVERFAEAGHIIMASEEDLRTFDALRAMEGKHLPGFRDWLRARRPASHTVLMRAVFGDPPEQGSEREPVQPTGAPTATTPSVQEPRFIDVALPPVRAHAVANGGNARGGNVYVGAIGDKSSSSIGAIGDSGKGQVVIDTAGTGPEADPEDPLPEAVPVALREDGRHLHLDLQKMAKHTGVFAGSGSGKTVLLRRIIESAALQGVSSIVLDSNNDLARLGTAWPARPESWFDGDEEAARRYHDEVEVVVWTPGRKSGRPLSFQPLPDFASVRDDQDDFEQAIETAVSSLVPRARIGRSTAKDDRSRAILKEALEGFAERGRSDFGAFLDYLDELPEDASSFAKAPETAAQIAATLRAAVVNDRVFAGDGSPVDPGLLLTPSEGKRARVSVVNFMGLPAEEQRQGFVNQLELALFAWAKQHPAVDRPLSGLFVLDEAQNLAPSTGSSICLASTIALASQARKYGLGMLFATQSPKGIHNRIVGNCATHWYGRMNSPTQIAAASDVALQTGGSPVDLAHLRQGQFYLVADGKPTERVDAPMCLSHHPPTAPTADEILAAIQSGGAA